MVSFRCAGAHCPYGTPKAHSATTRHLIDSAPIEAFSLRAPVNGWLGDAWSIVIIWFVARFSAALNRRQQPQKNETPEANTEYRAQDARHQSPPSSMKISAQKIAVYKTAKRRARHDHE
jgi:hypothetical protein